MRSHHQPAYSNLNPAHIVGARLTVVRFDRFRIQMCFGDHPTPYCHVVIGSDERIDEFHQSA